MESEGDFRQQFYDQANELLKSLNIKFQEKAVIKLEMHDKIVRCLTTKNSKEFTSKFVSWCRNSFVIQRIGTTILLCDRKTRKPVLLYEKMFDIFKQIHTQLAHAGRDKCLDSLASNYSWFNRSLLQIFIKNCSSCQQRKAVVKPMLSKPIIVLEFMTRIQMDLIDMRTRPDIHSNGKVYRWILQLKDHFTKFCWAKPLEHKQSREVYNWLREIFFLFGAPRILQSDNGREFVNDLINSLQGDFPGMCIVHERPRHPQSQGLIERANAILTDALGKWMDDNSSNHWSEGLPFVIFSINTRTTHTTKKTPYQLVFGQEPKTNNHYWQAVHDAAQLNDVPMNDLIIDKLPSNECQEKSSDTYSTSSIEEYIEASESSLDLANNSQNENQEDLFTLTSSDTSATNESRHEAVRKLAQSNYLKAQNKRQKSYDEHVQKIADSFKNGDLVGIPVNKVDRTNCDAKIMPCIIEKRSNNTEMPSYHLICQFGRLATTFAVHQLIPMSGVKPVALQNIHFETLPTITIVQACKQFARGNAIATCDCKTKCLTKTCPCRRLSVSCSTKCHSKRGKCSNNKD